MAYKDPLDERARAARRKHYQNNKEQYYARNEKKEQSFRHFVDAVKSYPCSDCGNTYPPYIMDLDHLPEFEKKGNVSNLVKLGSWSKLTEEVMKCDSVCSNCHRQRTHERGRNELDN